MNEAHPELSRRAFDGLLEMKASQSRESLDRIAGELFASLGLPSFALASFFDAARNPDTKVIAGRFQPQWSRRYIARRYARSSAIASEMFLTTSPYTWSGVIRRRGVQPDQARIWREAADCGLTDGIFTPVRWADGSYAAVVVAGDRPRLDDRFLMVTAEILSAYYCSEVRRLADSNAVQPLRTARQRECLAWVRQGKSSAAIAEMLDISVLTVDEHIAEACRRLRVRTRVQAAVEAALCGLID